MHAVIAFRVKGHKQIPEICFCTCFRLTGTTFVSQSHLPMQHCTALTEQMHCEVAKRNAIILPEAPA